MASCDRPGCGADLFEITSLADPECRYCCSAGHIQRIEGEPWWCELCREHHVGECVWAGLERIQSQAVDP